jgi:MFS family permease
VAVDLIGFGIVLPILPIYAKRFHTSSFEAALLVTAFSAASFVCSPLWGRLSDRLGRRPVLIVSLAGSALGSLVTGLAVGPLMLFVGRIVDGGSGASVSVAQAAAADLAPPGERTRLFGLLGAAFGLGFVAGPAIGALGALGGPRLPFFLAAGLAMANTVVAWRRLPETRHMVTQPASEKRSMDALIDAAPFLWVAFSALLAFSGFEATFALFGQHRLGLGIGSAAAVFTGVGAVIVVVQGGLVGRLTSLIGEGRTLVAGLAVNVIGLVFLAQAYTWAVALPSLICLTVGQGLIQTTMASTVAARADPSSRGQVLGAQQSAVSLGRIAGPVIAGALLGGHASGAPYLFGAAVTAVAALAAAASCLDLNRIRSRRIHTGCKECE